MNKKTLTTLLLVSVFSILILGILESQKPLAFHSKENTWIFIFAGQSNMSGRGHIPLNDQINTYNNIYTIDSGLDIVAAKHPVNWDPSYSGYSIAIDFAEGLKKTCEDCVFLIIPAAFSSVSIRDWQRNKDLRSLVEERVDVAESYGTFRGVLWHQGETDSTEENSAYLDSYASNFSDVIGWFRIITNTSELPFVAGTLPDFLSSSKRHPNYAKINSKIKESIELDGNASLVELNDLDEIGDHVHFSTRSIKVMADRYIENYKKYHL